MEVPGSDGTQFVIQTGHRLSYTTYANFIPTDPDIFRSGNLYYLYISYGAGSMVYTSNTLHGNYTKIATLPNGILTSNNAGVLCGLFFSPNNLYYSYGHRNAANGSEITMAKHADFAKQANYVILFTGNSIRLGSVQVASPVSVKIHFWQLHRTKFREKNAFIIYPNFATSSFTMNTSKPFPQLSIMDLTGKIIYLHRNIASND